MGLDAQSRRRLRRLAHALPPRDRRRLCAGIQPTTEGEPQMGTLTGTVAVVTGAARGIGRAIAEELGRNGATVVVNYAHSQAAAEEVVTRLRQDGSPEAIALHADVSDKAQAQQLIDETIQRFGRLDVLVNNGGVGAGATALTVTWQRASSSAAALVKPMMPALAAA